MTPEDVGSVPPVETVSKDEFESRYLKRSGISVEKYRLMGFMTLPCACDSDLCKGWAAVSPSSLMHHLAFCLPDKARLMELDLEP